jgi:hypothetical protein
LLFARLLRAAAAEPAAAMLTAAPRAITLLGPSSAARNSRHKYVMLVLSPEASMLTAAVL